MLVYFKTSETKTTISPDKICEETSAVQTPGFSPLAPAPAPAKNTPAPGKKLRLRQKTCENWNLIEF